LADALRIVVLGIAGNAPFAGVGWQTIQYLEGLRRLGHDVFYVEDTGAWPYDPEADSVSDDATAAVAYVRRLVEWAGFGGRWAYVDAAQEGRVHGLGPERLGTLYAEADLLVNVSGASVLHDEQLGVPMRIYLETDPVTPQIELAQGRQFTIDLLSAHTHHFSYGENFGAPDCGVPLDDRFDFRPTRPPIVLDWWPVTVPATGDGAAFTTVANWKQAYKDIEWNGETYTWSKDVEFMRFIDLPSRVDWPLELALALDDRDVIALLERHGWRVVHALSLSKDLETYRRYVRASAGEFSVAKEQNVRLRSGWFSDRTATYLAAGRPAIVQDTGFGAAIPTGEGLFAFGDIDEATAAFAAVRADYTVHSAAARGIAERHFRAETVLARLLADAGI
jgi:hypothetical protein